MRNIEALLFTHLAAAAAAWANGWIAGQLHARRHHLEAEAWEQLGRPIALIDLTVTPRPYDWQRDGECVPLVTP